MTRLTQLPVELLRLTLDFLRGDPKFQKTLYSLCLVSKHFLPVTLEALYAAPEAHWLEYRDLWVFADRLVHTLMRRPDLASLVRQLNLHIPTAREVPRPTDIILSFDKYVEKYPERGAMVRNWNLGEWTAGLLYLTPKLEILEISSDVWGRYDEDPPSLDLLMRFFDYTNGDFVNKTIFQSLRKLTLCHVTAIAPWIILPNLQTLEIDSYEAWPVLSTSPNLEVKNLTVHFRLELFYNTATMNQETALAYEEWMTELSARCPKLRNLRLYFLENRRQAQSLRLKLDWGWNHLVDKIVVAAHTLESLDLTCAARAIPINRDWLFGLLCLDSMTHFKKLKSLTVFYTAIFIPGDDTTPNYVAELPESLEHLHVQWKDCHFLDVKELHNTLLLRTRRLPRLEDLRVYDGPGGDLIHRLEVNGWESEDLL